MIPEFETTLGAPKGPARPAESKPAPASVEPAAAVPMQKIPSGFKTALKAIEAEHRKPRRATRTFSSTKERETFLVTEEVEALLPLLPEQVCVAMLGGALGMAQVPSDERRVALLRAAFAKSAGLEGARVKGLRAMLCAVRTYAATELHLPDRKKADAACFPMSATLVATVIADADVKARTRGSGSQKGATVGHKLRETFIYAAEKLLWPIEVPRVVLNAAAPKPTLLKRSKAGTLPLGAKCQLEHLARGGPIDGVSAEAGRVCTFYARSLLAAGIDQSLRVAEGARIELCADPEDPGGVMYGHAYVGKDGAPMDVYAPAEGFLGRYQWYAEHLAECVKGGQVFPLWEKPRGSRGVIHKAGGIDWSAAAPKPDIRVGLKQLLQLPPLALLDEEVRDMNIQGHTGHTSEPEWGRCLGQFPSLVNIESVPSEEFECLKIGFSDRDIDALGHWMRNANSKAEATASEAASAAQPADARRAAAIASLPGKGASKGAMRNYYGAAGADPTRFSERYTQIRVRQRLVRTVRTKIEMYLKAKGAANWTALPRGQADLAILCPEAATGPAQPEAQHEAQPETTTE